MTLFSFAWFQDPSDEWNSNTKKINVPPESRFVEVDLGDGSTIHENSPWNQDYAEVEIDDELR